MKKLLVLLLCLCLMMSCTGCMDAAVDPVITPAPESTEEAFVESEEPDEEIMQQEEEEEIVVDELLEVENLMINPELEDKGWMNILLLGGDSRGKNSYGRTDAILILSLNQTTGEAKLTSIMRDTWVKIYNKGEQKINAANVFGGPELAIRTVNEHFDMNISKYALVNMSALASIIDAMGGVTLSEVTERQREALNEQLIKDKGDFNVVDPTPLAISGKNVKLTGNQALSFARIRYLDSDYARVERQRMVLIGIAQNMKNMGIGSAIGLIPTLLQHVETNLDMNDMLALVNVGLKLDMNNVAELRLPAEGTYKSGTINGTWKIVPDFERNTEILHEFIYGAEVDEELNATPDGE